MLRRVVAGRTAWLIAVLFSAAGCATIDDNTDDCFPTVRLRFEYTYNLANEDRFAQQVESVELFAYLKKDSTFIGSKRYEKAAFSQGNRLALTWLPMRDCYLLAFGNKDDNYYQHTNHNYITGLCVKTICSDGQGTVVDNPCHLFYGMVEITAGDSGEKTVAMKKDTNDIIVVVHDLTPDRTRASGVRAMEVNVTAKNGTIKHDNLPDENDMRLMRHITHPTEGTVLNRYSSTMTVGRLMLEDASQMVLKEKESGRVLVSENITEKIAAVLAQDPDYSGMDPQEYFDRQDKYTFTYTLELVHNVEVFTLIRINDWNRVVQGGSGGTLW